MTPQLSLTLITLRDVFQWAAHKKDPQEYQSRSALVRLHPSDLKALGVKDGALVRLSNPQGEVIVKAKADPRCPQGYGLMPVSPYANLLAEYAPGRGGLPNFKRIPVIAEPAQGEVTPLSALAGLALERR